jgi:ribosomal protein L7/L12
MFNSLFGSSDFTPGQVARLQRLERKIDLILRHLGIEYTEPDPADDLAEPVRALADAGEKIQAIKAYRELTGAGLAEAKRVVEAYMDRKS